MRASGVFTGTTNSPSHSPRQSLYRYTIRAGRNLPDKEFRYLRTVIVTAAVHRGFSSGLRPNCLRLSPCFNLPAPGRRHPLYVVFDFAESCVFVKQSQSAFHCGPLGLSTLPGHPIVITPARWGRNVDLLSIGYASRPHLRSRLTLSGLTFLRKP